MIKTMQKSRKKISNLSIDIELVNPIESKSLFGGCNYGHSTCPDYCVATYGGWSNGDTIYISQTQWSSGGPMDPISTGWSQAGSGGYIDDWNNYDGNNGNNGGSDNGSSWVDNNGDGINDVNHWIDIDGNGTYDADLQFIYDDYDGYDLTAPEALWLYMHLPYVNAMYNNQQLAFAHGQGHNGVGDALRHALWSALDAFDIGAGNAHEFHTLHESTHWDDTESPSDLHNNGWGYNWAIINGDPEANMTQFLSDFDAAVANGHLSIIP